ncbi:MAG: putative ribonucleotide transport ATP-binding protein mkl [Chlamydiae bacterium]|nr:putative ribonucleotide transport ATP-binding protein mkl [Chlamydiota bacterium]
MIVCEDVWKSYDDLQVLKGLDLTVQTGETLVVLGRSGVGKSVLLKQLMGLEKPEKGRIYIDEVCLTELKEQELYHAIRHMGMLFQGGALFDSLTVEDNIGFYLNEHKDVQMSKEEIKDRVNEALKFVDLEGTNDKMPAELSGGMKKRAAIARLIAYRPTILFYDEPTTGLDPITADQINHLIRTVQQELNATSVVVTHDIQAALVVADRLALNEDGVIKYIDTPQNFLKIQHPTIEFLYKMMYENKDNEKK